MHNHAVKPIILKNFKLLQNDPDTGRIFSQPPLISFKRDKNIGYFLVKQVISPELLNGHAHHARHVLLFATLRNCWDHFTCNSTNVIYCITCTLCSILLGQTWNWEILSLLWHPWPWGRICKGQVRLYPESWRHI